MKLDMRGVINGLILMSVVYALLVWLVFLPHAPCDPLAGFSWVRCTNP